MRASLLETGRSRTIGLVWLVALAAFLALGQTAAFGANAACPDAAASSANSCTFLSTGGAQTFTVPADVSSVDAFVDGARGGGYYGGGGGGGTIARGAGGGGSTYVLTGLTGEAPTSGPASVTIVFAPTVVVTTTADSGPGSLRAAITTANSTAGYTIDFAIPGAGVHTITPASALPTITNPMTIDGTSQPGFAGAPVIRLDGASVSGGTGLLSTAGSTVVRGLMVTGWAHAGIELQSANGSDIIGNRIGTNGSTALGNGDGVLIDSGSSNNTVGGSVATARNLISGNSTGISITGGGTSGNVVDGNLIGTNPAATSAIPNTTDGILIAGGASTNTVGGTVTGSGNVISGNGSSGVALSAPGTTGNLVEGNTIGTNAARTAALANSTGVSILDGATTNTVGGTSPAARNLISGNGDGVDIFGGIDGNTTGNTVEGNFIGTNPAGSGALANATSGVSIGSGAFSNTIGGTAPGSRDLISGNGVNGVNVFVGCSFARRHVRHSTTTLGPNVIEGDYIGTNVSGTAALANGSDGVFVGACSFSTTIGGTIAAARNLISANGTNGVEINQASSALVEGNYIGTTVTGAAALANTADGVLLSSASSNTVGGAVAGAGNLISANKGNGVEFTFGASSNTVAGNSIGTNVAHAAALANKGDGIHVASGANANTVGGTTALARNLISGNAGNGVAITDSGTSTNVLEGNYIGPGPSGTSALANQGDGVLIEGGATSNTVGGTTASARNLISGNTSYGVAITGSGTSTNLLEGNYIGTTASGTATLANGGADGVRIDAGATGNTVGGTAGGAGNKIAFASSGVEVNGATTFGDAIQQNSIFSNSLGIVLSSGNHSLAAPAITSVTTAAGSTTISGTAPTGRQRIELYTNPSCSDPEGAKFVGAVVTSNGAWSRSVAALATGLGVTATTTQYPAHDTSAFSSCVTS